MRQKTVKRSHDGPSVSQSDDELINTACESLEKEGHEIMAIHPRFDSLEKVKTSNAGAPVGIIIYRKKPVS